MWIIFFIGQLPKLSKNKKAKELLRNAPSYVQKWKEVLGSFQDGEKPSMEIDLDFYDDEVVETIDDDIKVYLNKFWILVQCGIWFAAKKFCKLKPFLHQNFQTFYSKEVTNENFH